jgi:two-component system, response regulator PdtaR
MDRNGADKGARLRILIVEDDARIAMDTEDALVQTGCEVVGVANRCQTAVELCGAEHPDLVVMDISLAGERDGVEAAILIRQLFDIPTLFVSGQNTSDLVPRASEARALGWISKPLDRRKLASAVEKARHHASEPKRAQLRSGSATAPVNEASRP